MELTQVPLGIGTLAAATGSAAGGTALTVRGSGFQPGAIATLAGKNAPVGFVGMNTLKITSPALTAGARQLVITNPDGEAASYAAPFIVTEFPSPICQPARVSLTFCWRRSSNPK